jgi:uncharacterized membrane protein YdjX (TVP38/TMEM64 family)
MENRNNKLPVQNIEIKKACLDQETTQVTKSEIIRGTLIIGGIFILLYFLARSVGFEDIQGKVAEAGVWGPIILISLKAITLIVAPIGGAPLLPVAGILFGFTKGFTYVLIGDIIGSTVSFYLSRIFGRKIIQYFVFKPGMKIVNNILCYLETTKGLFYASIVFFAIPEAINYAAGLTKVPFWKFLLITTALSIPFKMLLVAFGEIIINQISTVTFIAVGAGGLLFALLGSWWFFKQSKESVSSI